MAEPGPRQTYQSAIIKWMDVKKVLYGGSINIHAEEGAIVQDGSSGEYIITDNDNSLIVSLPITVNPPADQREDHAFIQEPPETTAGNTLALSLSSSNFRKFLFNTFAPENPGYVLASSYTIEINYNWIVTGGSPAGTVRVNRSANTLRGTVASIIDHVVVDTSTSASLIFTVDTTTWELTE